MFYKRLRSSNYWHLRHYLTPPKKHVLNYFALELDAIVARRRHCREQRTRHRRERIFPLVFIYLECQKNTFSENIIFQSMLFFICFRKQKTTWNPHLGVMQYQLYQNCCNPSFFDLRFFSTYCGFFILNLRLCWFACYVGRYVNEMLRLCSLICALLVNHPQKFPRPSAQFWNGALALICSV